MSDATVVHVRRAHVLVRHLSGLSTRRGRSGARALDRPPVPAASQSAQLESFDLDDIKQTFQEQGFAIVRGVVENSVRASVQSELEALVRVNV